MAVLQQLYEDNIRKRLISSVVYVSLDNQSSDKEN